MKRLNMGKIQNFWLNWRSSNLRLKVLSVTSVTSKERSMTWRKRGTIQRNSLTTSRGAHTSTLPSRLTNSWLDWVISLRELKVSTTRLMQSVRTWCADWGSLIFLCTQLDYVRATAPTLMLLSTRCVRTSPASRAFLTKYQSRLRWCWTLSEKWRPVLHLTKPLITGKKERKSRSTLRLWPLSEQAWNNLARYMSRRRLSLTNWRLDRGGTKTTMASRGSPLISRKLPSRFKSTSTHALTPETESTTSKMKWATVRSQSTSLSDVTKSRPTSRDSKY